MKQPEPEFGGGGRNIGKNSEAAPAIDQFFRLQPIQRRIHDRPVNPVAANHLPDGVKLSALGQSHDFPAQNTIELLNLNILSHAAIYTARHNKYNRCAKKTPGYSGKNGFSGT